MKRMVVKSNQLVQASYTLGLVEQRLILMSIVTARENGDGIRADTLCHIRAEDYARLFDVTRQTAYQALSDAVETLFNRRVTVECFDQSLQRIVPLTVRWVTAMNYLENEALVTLRFGPEVIPHITRLEANFTGYDLQQVADLKSAYAVRLYELLIRWRSTGRTPVFAIEDFRGQMGLHPDEYQRMGAFKERVLDLAIQQINQHTDINVSYQQQKQGRLVVGFSFSFEQKRVIEAVQPPTRKPKPQTQKTADPIETWDRLHALELKSCQAIQPDLTREMVEQQAKQQGKSMIQVMQQIQIAAVVRRNPAST